MHNFRDFNITSIPLKDMKGITKNSNHELNLNLIAKFTIRLNYKRVPKSSR